MRPTTGPVRREGRPLPHSLLRHKRKPPRGMYINHDDLVCMATGPAGQGESMLKAMDREIVSLKRLVSWLYIKVHVCHVFKSSILNYLIAH